MAFVARRPALPSIDLGVLSAPVTVALVGLAFLAAGAAVAFEPLVLAAIALLVYVFLRGDEVVRDGLTFLLLANVLFNYGFANIGLRLGGMPMPLTELVLLPLVGWCVMKPKLLRGIGAQGYLLAGVVGLALLRLIVDLPSEGNFAIRDFTTPLEATIFLAGYWTFNKHGYRWTTRFWAVVYFAFLAYAMFYPIREQMAAMGPVVGLQKAVPLLGQYSGSGSAACAALFYTMLRMRGPKAVLLGAVCLGIMALFQSRGIYLALPITIGFILFVDIRLRTGAGLRLLGSTLVAAGLLVAITPLNLQGRMGPLTVATAVQQIETLMGKEGPGDGSFDDRAEWADQIIYDQFHNLDYFLVGQGLGKDLNDGFAIDGVLVRKPHNDYLEIFARYGIIGLGLWAGFFASLLLPVWRMLRSGNLNQDESSYLLWLLATVSICLFIPLTQPELAFPYGTLPMFMMLGQALAFIRSKEPAATPPAAETESAA